MEDWSVGTNVYMPAWLGPVAAVAAVIGVIVIAWLLWRQEG